MKKFVGLIFFSTSFSRKQSFFYDYKTVSLCGLKKYYLGE